METFPIEKLELLRSRLGYKIPEEPTKKQAWGIRIALALRLYSPWWLIFYVPATAACFIGIGLLTAVALWVFMSFRLDWRGYLFMFGYTTLTVALPSVFVISMWTGRDGAHVYVKVIADWIRRAIPWNGSRMARLPW